MKPWRKHFLLKSILILISLLTILLLLGFKGAEESVITLYPILDSYVSSLEPSANFGNDACLYAYHYHDSETGLTSSTNSYIMFDLSDIPSNVKIDSAVLKLFIIEVPEGVEIELGVHHCRDVPQSEFGITWENAPSFNPTPTDTTIAIESTCHYIFDVSKDAQTAWLEDKKLTELLKMEKSLDEGIMARLCSKQSPFEDRRPRLEITYLVPT